MSFNFCVELGLELVAAYSRRSTWWVLRSGVEVRRMMCAGSARLGVCGTGVFASWDLRNDGNEGSSNGEIGN